MKINKDLRSGLPRMMLEKSDVSDLAKIEEMFSGKFHCNKCGIPFENSGWEIFKQYLKCEKMKLEFENENTVSLNTIGEIDFKKVAIGVAIVKGFRHFMEMEDRLMIKLKKLREEPKENDNDGANAYGD